MEGTSSRGLHESSAKNYWSVRVHESDFKQIQEIAKTHLKRAQKYVGSKRTFNPHHLQKQLDDLIQAYGSECALARQWDLPWPKSSNNFEGPDVGDWLQLKWSGFQKPSLLVKVPTKKLERPLESYGYVLVTGRFPLFYFVGWIGGEFVTTREPRRIVQHPKYPLNYIVEPDEMRTDWETLRKIATSSKISADSFDDRSSPLRSSRAPRMYYGRGPSAS